MQQRVDLQPLGGVSRLDLSGKTVKAKVFRKHNANAVRIPALKSQ
jgi:hypothetical protein